MQDETEFMLNALQHAFLVMFALLEGQCVQWLGIWDL